MSPMYNVADRLNLPLSSTWLSASTNGMSPRREHQGGVYGSVGVFPPFRTDVTAENWYLQSAQVDAGI